MNMADKKCLESPLYSVEDIKFARPYSALEFFKKILGQWDKVHFLYISTGLIGPENICFVENILQFSNKSNFKSKHNCKAFIHDTL